MQREVAGESDGRRVATGSVRIGSTGSRVRAYVGGLLAVVLLTMIVVPARSGGSAEADNGVQGADGGDSTGTPGDRSVGIDAPSLPAAERGVGPLPTEALPERFRDQPPPAGAGGEFVTDFSRATVHFGDILSGGPPKDGIPSIDAPRFDSAAVASRDVAAREPVLVVTIRGETHIYPLQILTWHEIVNDTVGGVPVAVTFCPLCNTGITFDRRLEGEVLEFGTTGRLRYSNLIMYDRTTESWWQQADGAAIAGHYAGARLVLVPTLMLPFGEAVELHPDAEVLSRDTGFARSYGTNPYAGYDTSPGPFLFRGWLPDGVTDPFERILEVEHGGEKQLFSYAELEQDRVQSVELAGDPVVAIWQEGTSSALDGRSIAESRDVGSANAFLSRTESGRAVTLVRRGDRVVDEETGSTWNVAGRAVAGRLAGEALIALPSAQHFWFSAATFSAIDRADAGRSGDN